MTIYFECRWRRMTSSDPPSRFSLFHLSWLWEMAKNQCKIKPESLNATMYMWKCIDFVISCWETRRIKFKMSNFGNSWHIKKFRKRKTNSCVKFQQQSKSPFQNLQNLRGVASNPFSPHLQDPEGVVKCERVKTIHCATGQFLRTSDYLAWPQAISLISNIFALVTQSFLSRGSNVWRVNIKYLLLSHVIFYLSCRYFA